MFDFAASSNLPKARLYRELLSAADALTSQESDSVANMANIAALLWQFLPDVNWTGFYRTVDGELVLGPFAGRPACIRIAIGSGVCGAAAKEGAVQIVPDVHEFAGHIACDGATRSELVVPVLQGGAVIAVIDLDSPSLARFDGEDAAGIEALAALLSDRI